MSGRASHQHKGAGTPVMGSSSMVALAGRWLNKKSLSGAGGEGTADRTRDSEAVHEKRS